ncbi:MAG: nitroreductase [Oscillibacter sp. CAG:241_62_21]|jgi:nitroreductase|nr:MAG: nitroreductase [Oscillibacter sp. CAG:241_62_21]
MEILEIMQQRHSVRQYTDRAIEPEKRAVLDALTQEINRKAGLSVQIIYDDPKCFDSFMAHYGKFAGVRNYIALVGKKAPGLDETLGYYGEELVLKAQELGLNTCWVALTHGKSKAAVGRGEKEVCLIALGYGVTQGVEHKSRPMQELCTCGEPMPEWFRCGMNAAMLAPTAMNQQKFRFELLPDGTVKAACGSGFYTKLDLGIVKYHFEAVTGKKTV